MKRYFENLCVRAGRRLQALGQQRALRSFPGSIRVAGMQITGLRPLGGFQQPGVTKAGRLSFAGYCEGRKVKVYSAYGPAQIALRQAVQGLDLDGCGFTELLAVDDELVVEAWVEGCSVTQLPGDQQLAAAERVRQLLHELHHGKASLALATAHDQAFCYLQDYLLVRLGVWRHWSLVADFLQQWQARYAELGERLPVRLSHPDLSAANLVLEQGSGRLLIIDNELLGVGRGWILDGRNSLLHADLCNEGGQPVPDDFVQMTWRLRQLGSALDANDFSRAQALCQA
ncbi:hypothetical protein [Pseudomonas xionganensis]|uniref:Aminoglycoside phosphotransferase domain-containing protein n=1 Tax=Pseudomonas xionganensis TaxID=2654845 RepID=A0A6I4KW46_9PSED|nr:hypothetical protein [Pseudomonas xionganensis]MVW76084.1 hypothetical protein [Pseudomonas xionganensis]